jgi:hypothetical protein
MNKETQNILHDLRRQISSMDTCLKCIAFDLKDEAKPSADDVNEIKESLKNFETIFKTFAKGLNYELKK